MKAREILQEHEQGEIIKLIDELDQERLKVVEQQIEKIDFEQLERIYKKAKKDDYIMEDKIENIDYVDLGKLDKDIKDYYKKIGEDVIKQNKYAVVTMAGGQGTRLGHTGPKGTYKIELEPEPKYLFEIIVDTLQRNNDKYGIVLNWYIMTSDENTKQTVDFLEEHNYFGYPKENVKVFLQGNMPILNEEGKLIVSEDYTIREAADGNGDIYRAMVKGGIVDDMKQKNIEWVFIGSVDNVLLKMIEPELLGLTIEEGNLIGTKSIAKAHPHERVGVFCKRNGAPSVIEYSELPTEMAELVDDNGELVFGESHVMCNLFNIKAIEKIANQKLPYHVAHKKIKYIDMNTKTLVEPTEPNAYKFEAFIFDGFNYFDNISIMRGVRKNEFAPVKNASGSDSPETAAKLYNEYWSKN